MNDHAARRGEQGFTLIELLVSLAILSLVATMLLGGIAMAAKMAGRLDRQQSANDEIITAQAILRDRIEHLHPLRRLDRTEPVVDAEGTENLFTFYAPPAPRTAPDSLQRYRLLQTATGDLVLFSAPALSDSVVLDGPGVIGWIPSRLLTGIGHISIAYFGPDASGTVRRWQAFWNERPQPPELVRIRIRFSEGDLRRWPDLIVHPRVALPAVCQKDPVTGACMKANHS